MEVLMHQFFLLQLLSYLILPVADGHTWPEINNCLSCKVQLFCSFLCFCLKINMKTVKCPVTSLSSHFQNATKQRSELRSYTDLHKSRFVYSLILFQMLLWIQRLSKKIIYYTLLMWNFITLQTNQLEVLSSESTTKAHSDTKTKLTFHISSQKRTGSHNTTRETKQNTNSEKQSH